MTTSAKPIRGTIVPTLRYYDVPAAIAWLCEAFGLEKHLVVAGQDGSVSYAQLAFGDGLVMLGSAEASVDGLMTQPDRTGGLETQICYLFVDDARAHYARAKAAGAAIVLDIDDETSGGRGYSCRDPQGHVWNFGTYDPRARQSVHRAPPPTARQRYAKRMALVVGNLANAVTVVAFLGWLYAATEQTVAHASVPIDGQIVQDLERSIRDTREQLMREKAAKEQAERLVAQIREQLTQERNKPTTDAALNELRAALQKAELAAAENGKRLIELERAAQKAREEAALERGGRAAAERAMAEAKEQLAKERLAREQADKTAKLAREQVKKPVPAPKSGTTSTSPSSGLLWQ